MIIRITIKIFRACEHSEKNISKKKSSLHYTLCVRTCGLGKKHITAWRERRCLLTVIEWSAVIG